MKTGILTFHNAHNYGAVLQAFALKHKLIEMGYEAHIINYRNKNIENQYDKNLKVKLSIGDFIYIKRLMQKIKFRVNIPYAQECWKNQWQKFEDFINQYLIESADINIDDICGLNYDAIIVGSDQVWSSWITGGLDSAYLFDFKYDGKKIYYAASISDGIIPNSEADKFSAAIKSADAVSVREKPIAVSIKNLFNLEVNTVVDPTLLLDIDVYDKLAVTNRIKENRYVFAYYVTEDKCLTHFSNKIANLLGCKLTELHYYAKKGFDSETQFADFSPEEFITAIKHAEFVLTNSFHGTVFSILYHKEFYSVVSNNSRIDNLLSDLQIKNRIVYTKTDLKLPDKLDYTEIERRLKKYRQSSIDFLTEALDT